MMKTIFIFLAIIPGILLGQVVINAQHMPSSGDSLRFSIAPLDTSVLLNYQNSGANLSWNFDSLVATRQSTQHYLASSQTPYSAQVPNRIGRKLADTIAMGAISLYDVYDFYDINNNEFALDYRGASIPTGLGFPFPPTLTIGQAYSDKDEVYQFPLNYTDRDSSTFNFLYNNALIGAYYGTSGYRINEVDAWGTLSTPYGTFNCIRVITDILSTDTISFGGNNIGFDSHTREYKWLTPQLKIPALSITGNVIAGVFIPTAVQYRDSVRSVPSLFAPTALFNANPTEYGINDTVEFNNLSISLVGASYEWNITPNTFNYTNNSSSTTDSLFVQFTNTGYYDVQLIARNSYGSDTLTRLQYINIVNPIGINETRTNNFKLFPNPISKNELLTIELNSNQKINAIELFDIDGSNVIRKSGLKSYNAQIKIKTLNPGIYIVKIYSNSSTLFKKLIIQ